MIRAAFATALLLAGALNTASAYRVLEEIEDAHELVLGEVTLPGSEAGSVIFKACSTCTGTTLRVSAATTYFLNGAQLSLADFLRAAEDIRRTSGGNQNTAVYVFFDIASKRVNRIALDQLGG